MNTAIDVGNSFTKVGFFENDEPAQVLQFATQPLSNLYKHLSTYNFGNCIISSVVDIPEHINHYLKAKSVKYIQLNTETPLPIKINYSTPETLGKDRVAIAVAANSFFPEKNVLAINLGTCVTYNMVDENGFQGGAISPGMYMRLQAMNYFTAKLPLPQIPEPKHFNTENLTAKSTDEALLQGGIYGLLMELQGYIYSYAKKYLNLHVILSGGDGRYVAELLQNKTQNNLTVKPELTLIGLNKILQFNVGNKKRKN